MNTLSQLMMCLILLVLFASVTDAMKIKNNLKADAEEGNKTRYAGRRNFDWLAHWLSLHLLLTQRIINSKTFTISQISHSLLNYQYTSPPLYLHSSLLLVAECFIFVCNSFHFLSLKVKFKVGNLFCCNDIFRSK